MRLTHKLCVRFGRYIIGADYAWPHIDRQSLVSIKYATYTSSIRHFICPPKFCITFAFHFSWVLKPSQEKLKTMLTQNLGGEEGGQIRCFMGNVQMVYGLLYDWPSGWPLAQWTVDLCWYFLILLLELKSVLEFLKIECFSIRAAYLVFV